MVVRTRHLYTACILSRLGAISGRGPYVNLFGATSYFQRGKKMETTPVRAISTRRSFAGREKAKAFYTFVTGSNGNGKGQGLQPVWFVAKACTKASQRGRRNHSLLMPSSSTSRRRCSKQRARVGPMLPTGISNSFETFL